MKYLIKRNYQSIVKRGFIDENTRFEDFMVKLYEEVNELHHNISDENLREELADVILVALNMAEHYNIDIEKELINKIKINENR